MRLPVQAGAPGGGGGGAQRIQDNTETNLINLRRTIYLTIMSALDFEEAGHKLMKISLAPGQETEICTMIIECCSQEKSYSKCARVPCSHARSVHLSSACMQETSSSPACMPVSSAGGILSCV